MNDHVYCIAEIGINHNGSIDTAAKLINEAAEAGFDCVKFQKRTVDLVYTADELAKPRESVFGKTNGDLKRGLEFTKGHYDCIEHVCQSLAINWTASVWDTESVDFLMQYDPPFIKIPSALLTNTELLTKVRSTGKPVVLSTGMSTSEEIDRAVTYFQPSDRKSNLILMHCTSTYPAKDEELNLRCIQTLKEEYKVPVGYSGHERGLATTIAAVALGATMIERHVTLDRTMWGTDQAASVEVAGMRRLIRDIRAVEAALGDGVKTVYASELPIKAKLRR